MDFLLASYRKQRKWIHLRQLLLLLTRLVIAALLIAVLCGWTGGRDLLDAFGGRVTHHVLVLDDSYSMGDRSSETRNEGSTSAAAPGLNELNSSGLVGEASGANAYSRALSTVQDLTRYLANQDGEHQLTVMRASRAAMSTRAGSETGDAAADLSSQTIGEDARLINRLMSTTTSAVSVDLIPAIDLSTELLRTTPADEKYFYVLSDFRDREWGAADRLAESLRVLGNEVPIRLIDCAADSPGNLAITAMTPSPDVWVAGVPVMMRVTVRNYGKRQATRIPLSVRLIRYPDQPMQPDPSLSFSGEVEVLPELLIEELPPGQEITKTFQVYVSEVGTHAVQVSLPPDSLAIDNQRFCTLPLTAAERVLIIDSDVDGRGGYHIGSSLNPGGQVDVGVLPDVQPPSYLRSIDYKTLSAYRAVYLVDLPEISENATQALSEYVRRGGGLAWFLGEQVNASSYNQSLVSPNAQLLPAPLTDSSRKNDSPSDGAGDVRFGGNPELFGPLVSGGDGILSLVSVAESWGLNEEVDSADAAAAIADYQVCLKRRDGAPLITQHRFGKGRVMTSLMGINGDWTNWPGDPTFVVFLLQSNAWLWSAASPSVSRAVEMPYYKQLAASKVLSQAAFLPPSLVPPRVPFDITGEEEQASQVDWAEQKYIFEMSPREMLIRGDEHLDEILLPGLAEWSFLATDGTARIVPEASVIDQGDGDLVRAEHGSILQQLSPMNVRFLERRTWNEGEMASGSSAMAVLLLILLLLFFAVEQWLAYWASYHVTAKKHSAEMNSGGSKGKSTGQKREMKPRRRVDSPNSTVVMDGVGDSSRQTQGGLA